MERVKIKLVLAILLILGMSAQVSQASEPVTVYMTTDAAVLPMVLVNARSLTSQMFTRAGVAIEWRSGLPLNPPTSDERTVVVHLEGMNSPQSPTRCFGIRSALRRCQHHCVLRPSGANCPGKPVANAARIGHGSRDYSPATAREPAFVERDHES